VSALDHCGLKLYVHFLDLYRETEKNDDLTLDEISNALLDGVTGCEEVCLNHQCWLTIEPDSFEGLDLEAMATKAREEISKVIRELA
jgi:hypothetical protein